jgi:hypothetical protein
MRRIIISESKLGLLKEALSNKVYHYTSIMNMLEIALSNELLLSSKLGTTADDHGEKELYYLSLTRVKSSLVGFGRKYNSGGVRIEFNGTELSKRFRGKAFNYWGDTMGKHDYMKNITNNQYKPFTSNDPSDIQTQNKTESEDRLYSTQDSIPDIFKYITRIDIIIDLNNEKQTKYVYNILLSAFNSKVFVYDNVNDFNKQSNNTLNKKLLDTIPYGGVEQEPKYSQFRNIKNDLATIVGYILSGSDNVKKDASDLMSKYNAKKYMSGDFIKKVEDYANYSRLDNLANSVQNILGGISKNGESGDNRIPLRMISDYFKSMNVRSFKEMNTLKHNSFNQNELLLRNVDVNKHIDVLYFHEYTPILNPSKTLAWNVIDKWSFIYFMEDEMSKYHVSKNDESFKKYIQHIQKSNKISIQDVLNMVNNSKLPDEIKEEFYNNFELEYKNVGFWDLYNRVYDDKVAYQELLKMFQK